MILERVKKKIWDRQALGEALEDDGEVLGRIKSGYFEETKEHIVVNLENPIKNDNGDVLLEKLNIRKNLYVGDLINIEAESEKDILYMVMSIDKKHAKYVPYHLTEIIHSYFYPFVLNKKTNEIVETDKEYKYIFLNPIKITVSEGGEEKELKEICVEKDRELNTEDFSFFLDDSRKGRLKMYSHIFKIDELFLKKMLVSDFNKLNEIVEKLKKKHW